MSPGTSPPPAAARSLDSRGLGAPGWFRGPVVTRRGIQVRLSRPTTREKIFFFKKKKKKKKRSSPARAPRHSRSRARGASCSRGPRAGSDRGTGGSRRDEDDHALPARPDAPFFARIVALTVRFAAPALSTTSTFRARRAALRPAALSRTVMRARAGAAAVDDRPAPAGPQRDGERGADGLDREGDGAAAGGQAWEREGLQGARVIRPRGRGRGGRRDAGRRDGVAGLGCRRDGGGGGGVAVRCGTVAVAVAVGPGEAVAVVVAVGSGEAVAVAVAVAVNRRRGGRRRLGRRGRRQSAVVAGLVVQRHHPGLVRGPSGSA